MLEAAGTVAPLIGVTADKPPSTTFDVFHDLQDSLPVALADRASEPVALGLAGESGRAGDPEGSRCHQWRFTPI